MGNCYGLMRTTCYGMVNTCRSHTHLPKELRKKQLRTCPIRWSDRNPKPIDYYINMRKQFWNSRRRDYFYRQHVWNIIKEASDAFFDKNYETAQFIINFYQLYIPYGDLEFVMDYDGNEYVVPLFCLSYPMTMTRRKCKPKGPHTVKVELTNTCSGYTAEGLPYYDCD